MPKTKKKPNVTAMTADNVAAIIPRKQKKAKNGRKKPMKPVPRVVIRIREHEKYRPEETFQFLSARYNVERAKKLLLTGKLLYTVDRILVAPWAKTWLGIIQLNTKYLATITDDMLLTPGILVLHSVNAPLLIDGKHRLAKHAELGHTYMPVYVIQPKLAYKIRRPAKT